MLLVTARVDTFPGSSRIVAALLDPAPPGLRRSSSRTISGDRIYRLDFDGVIVAPADMMGTSSDAGIAREDLARLAQSFVALQCMEMVGGTRAVLDRTVDYVLVREQFGRPIGSFQAAQHLVADMRIGYDAARLTAYQALWCLAEGVPSLRAVAIAKMQCSEAYKRATLTAHQLHGGMGYVRETDLHLWSERAKTAEVLGGTADVAAGWLLTALGWTGDPRYRGRSTGAARRLRILDLSRWVAGEFATRTLADFGADVVKIEKPGEGSLTRHARTVSRRSARSRGERAVPASQHEQALGRARPARPGGPAAAARRSSPAPTRWSSRSGRASWSGWVSARTCSATVNPAPGDDPDLGVRPDRPPPRPRSHRPRPASRRVDR